MRKRKLAITLVTMCVCVAMYGNTWSNQKDTIESTAEKVTVFLSSAQVFRTADVRLKQGTNTIVMRHLSPFIDAKSIRIESENEVIIRSVNHTVNYKDDHLYSENLANLNRQIDLIQDSIKRYQAGLIVIEKKEKLLEQNRSMATHTDGLDLDKLATALALYDEVYTEINLERIRLNDQIELLKSRAERIKLERNKRSNYKREPFSEITIELDSDVAKSLTIGCSYLVKEAGWIPRYDIRAQDVSSPLVLQYQAQFWQRTRENWENVMLTFSSATPQNRSTLPTLRKWNMNFSRLTSYNSFSQKLNSKGELNAMVTGDNGEPLIGANVRLSGTSVGTITDIDGRFSLADPGPNQILEISYTGYESKKIPVSAAAGVIQLNEGAMLSEVVVTGSRSNRTNYYIDGKRVAADRSAQKRSQTVQGSFIENQTHFSIEVPIPYSIFSEGEPIKIPLDEYEINATYQYVTIPKLDPYAYLIATINDWNEYHILDGEANLFFENTFIGKTIINAKSFADSTTISLGRDLGIAVSRKKVNEYTRRKFIGGKRIDTRRFDIEVRNNKSESIQIMVIDQVPVSVNQQIAIDVEDLFGGRLDELSGEVKWRRTLEPGAGLSVGVAYKVKCPKNETVYLE